MVESSLKIGWAEADITPQRPVSISGNFSPRISEGIADPLNTTVWAVESEGEQAIFVSCDLVVISEELCEAIRTRVAALGTDIDPGKVIIHATHTHYAPETRPSRVSVDRIGIPLHEISKDIMTVEEYLAFASTRVANAIEEAWSKRAPGGMAYGMDYAVIGRNRRWVNDQGKGTMHGLNASTADHFRYIEGFEDHALYLVATYDADSKLTGLVINFACPAQVPGPKSSYEISADVWHEARQELRRRFGDEVFILPQCSAAGDQTGYIQFDKEAENRMLRLKGRTKRQEVAHGMASAIAEILPAIRQEIHTSFIMRHQVDQIQLTANTLSEEDVKEAQKQSEAYAVKYEEEKKKLAHNPEIRQNPRWYEPLTMARRYMTWHGGVAERFEEQKKTERPTLPAEIHVVRMGDIIFTSLPFEYYLDYGIQIKLRSPATQTFIVQLAGGGTYVPSARSLLAGGYGSMPQSNPIGAEGGQDLAEHIVQTIREIWG